jgi:hypothetical protein
MVSSGNTGNGAAAGVIYQIKSLVPPVPPNLKVSSSTQLTWDRGVLQESTKVSGPWVDVVDAFSPYELQTAAPQKFYRTRY